MIEQFQGTYRWLSNFWPAEVVLDGVTYPSVENAYQAAKFAPDCREVFVHCTAGKAKRHGKAAPPTTEDYRLRVMTELIDQKFNHPHLRKLLLDTGKQEIVEGNSWGDIFWGVCEGVGFNHLGNIIMNKRRTIRENQPK